MSATYAGSAVVCDGTTTIAGPIDIDSIQNNATASVTIAKSGITVFSGGAGAGAVVPMHFRSAGPIVVTVNGGGSVTLFLRVASERG